MNNSTHLAFLPTNIILNMALFLINSRSFHWEAARSFSSNAAASGALPRNCIYRGHFLRPRLCRLLKRFTNQLSQLIG